MLKLFAVLSLVDAGYSSSNFKTFLYGEEIKLADITRTNEEIKNDFVNHINSHWTRQNITELLIDYQKNDIVYLSSIGIIEREIENI
jgi:hypothetical protein